MFKKNIIPFCVILLFTSCFSDSTTLSDMSRLSYITCKDETPVDSVYDIYKNETLTLSPQMAQTRPEKGLVLSYEWEINGKTVCTDPVFTYTGDELGSFICRLIVSNNDGSVFYPFKINVVTPYDEGIAVLSKDAEGKSCLSFMRLNASDQKDTCFYDEELFSLNNPDIPFAPNAVDMVHTESSLYIMCQGDASHSPAIYNLQHKTFKIKNFASVTGYYDFKPTILALPFMPYPGNPVPIICENGKTYDFDSKTLAVGPATKLQYTYAQKISAEPFKTQTYNNVFWDNDANDLCILFNGGYGPYFCSTKYICPRDSVLKESSKYNYFNGDSFLTMVAVQITAQQKAASMEPDILVFTTRNLGFTNIKRTVLNYTFWKNNDEDVPTFSLTQPIAVCGRCLPGKSLPFDATTPMVATKLYDKMFYADGANVMDWNYIGDNLDKATVLQTVGTTATCQIASLMLSSDHEKIYVAFYDPTLTGKNGSMWVIKTDGGQVLEKYDNVFYKPIKMIYKDK